MRGLTLPRTASGLPDAVKRNRSMEYLYTQLRQRGDIGVRYKHSKPRALTEIGLADRLLAYAAPALIRMSNAGGSGYNMRAERRYYGGRISRMISQ